MKIAFFSSGLAYRLGGPSFSEALLIRELRKSIDVDVYIPKVSAEEKFLKDYGLEDAIQYKPSEILKHKENLKKANLIHLNGHWKWWYSKVSRFAVNCGIPYVLHPRGMMLVGHRRKQAKRVFNLALGNAIVKKAEKVIALSEYEKLQFKPYANAGKKTVVVPNPIDFKPKLKVSTPDVPNGVSEYFLYLGRIEKRKNLVFLVRAFKEYKHFGGTASLLIVGPVERGYDNEIREAIQKYGQEKNVFVLPPAYEVKRDQFLQHALALVYPASDEPFGRVPFEALAVGTVPIVPDKSGAAEYLAPYFPDCIYGEGNFTDLAKTLIKAEGIEAVRIEEAQNWVANSLSLGSIAKKIITLYEGILKSPSAHSLEKPISPIPLETTH